MYECSTSAGIKICILTMVAVAKSWGALQAERICMAREGQKIIHARLFNLRDYVV